MLRHSGRDSSRPGFFSAARFRLVAASAARLARARRLAAGRLAARVAAGTAEHLPQPAEEVRAAAARITARLAARGRATAARLAGGRGTVGFAAAGRLAAAGGLTAATATAAAPQAVEQTRVGARSAATQGDRRHSKGTFDHGEAPERIGEVRNLQFRCKAYRRAAAVPLTCPTRKRPRFGQLARDLAERDGDANRNGDD